MLSCNRAAVNERDKDEEEEEEEEEKKEQEEEEEVEDGVVASVDTTGVNIDAGAVVVVAASVGTFAHTVCKGCR